MKILTKKRICSQTFDDNFLSNPFKKIGFSIFSLVEKEILEKAQHYFIPKLLYTFENDKKIFLVKEHFDGGNQIFRMFIYTNLLLSGELNKILRQLTRLSEEITRFYSAEILLALEYLHDELGIVYK